MLVSQVPLAGPSGTAFTYPIIDDKVISLNGLGEDGCETFHLDRIMTINPRYPKHMRDQAKREGVFNFCKTERNPYDPVVVSILHAADVIAPGALELSSDGGKDVFKAMF